MARSKSCKSSFRLLLAIILLLLTESVPLRSTLTNSGLNLGCFEEERRALLEFKRSLNVSGLSFWRGEDCCSWERVGCSNQTGHVVKLDFSSVCGHIVPACSGGVLSPSLANLSHLNYLDLSGNVFKVPISSFIGSLQKLRYLDLSHSFVGLVPPHLGNLSNLLHLDLSSDSDAWVSDLKWLSGLPSLHYLGLRGVNLSHAIDHWVYSINMLPSLLELDLSFCQLHGILPQSLPHLNLTSLLVIDLSFNEFHSSLPPWLFNISTLVSANFSHSDFTGSVPEISLLKDMETLQLQQNSLSGPIPTSIGNLSHLRVLYLSGNSLSGSLPASIGNLLHLETLDLSGNRISGQLPMSVGNLSRLYSLDLSFNMIQGSIPKSIGQLTGLTTLKLSSNQWEGVITESHFENLTRLYWLELSSKSLVLNVSQDWIPSFNTAWRISLRDCQFLSPMFPTWLRSQSFLSILTLTNVGISDEIPEWFWKISPDLSWLDLSNNKLRGTLPNSVHFDAFVNLENNCLEGSIPLWPNVESLRLGRNRFTGSIPLNIDQEMSTLVLLDLSRNNLNGSIPHSLTKLKSLNAVDLSRNYLSGSIPKNWNGSKGIVTIDFSNNNLSGQFPPGLCSQQPSLFWLRLRNNNLSGKVGRSLQNCQNLYTLDLGGNIFSGAIPHWIGEDLPFFRFVLLGDNEFTGIIPRHLCGFSALHVLDLSHNNLSGSIPRCLGNLTQLTDLGGMPLLFPSPGNTPYMDSWLMPWHLDLDPKGVEYEYTTILPLVNTIDLSSNNLSGEIPGELRNLSKLGSLNLSRNSLTGKIPEDIGSLQLLQTLDLSVNHLQGPIPTSMTEMTLLNKLNLSYNDLSGPIPSANQFQTFNDPSLFEGNLGLCGTPLPTQCLTSPNGIPEVKDDADEDEQSSGNIWLYVSTTMGFILGFWAVFGSLLLKRSWRHAYFKFVDDMKDRLILIIIVKYMACVQRITKQEGQA